MVNTRLTLLQNAGNGSVEAWSELDALYRPFVHRWYRSQNLGVADADDLTQEVMTALYQELPNFRHSGNTGAFRTWLRGICFHRLLSYRRTQATRGQAIGGSDFYQQVQSVSETDPLIAGWDREHDQALLRYLFSIIAPQFAQETLGAFKRFTLEGVHVADVAAEYGISVGAVYVVRSRVLRRLREAAETLLGEEMLDVLVL